MGQMRELAVRARRAARALALASRAQKDAALKAMAEGLRKNVQRLLEANSSDMKNAGSLSSAMQDRLKLTPERIERMAEGLEQIAQLPDPVGEVLRQTVRPNGMRIKKLRVPIGVIAIIYESRPNVTADSAGLCLKSGNACILRGGHEAIESNLAIGGVLSEALERTGLPADAVQVVKTTDRAAVGELLTLEGLIDLVIPRGGKGLVKRVMEESMIPVIKHYEGICHVYVDAAADLDMAERIVVNAKVQRPGTCNAMETLLVHRAVAEKFLPRIARVLKEKGVEMRGCEQSRRLVPDMAPATEQDYRTEWLDLKMSVRVVPDIDAAIEHIETYGSHHSDSIVTADPAAARRFLEAVDSACVFHNVSTRMSDGFEFGMGAEIGISTDKLHARGPMGLEELTSYKYVIEGEGQLRS